MAEGGFIDKLRASNQGKIPFEGALKSIKARLYKFIIEDKRMGADLLFMMTYMAAIITAQATRPEIFAYTGARREYVSTRYIQKVFLFVRRWGYSYVEALVMVSKKVKNEMLKSMLNRYANAMESGVPDADYIMGELDTIRNVYRSHYEQGIEMLKKWGDAYISLLFSGALVGIIIMVSVAIFAPDDVSATLSVSYLLIGTISVLGLVMMFKAVPADPKTHGLSLGSPEQNMIHRIERRIVPVLIIIVVLLLFLGMNFGLILLLIGMLLFPIGVIGYIDHTNVTQRDAEFPTFIRGLGSIQGGKGGTMVRAIEEIDKKSLVVLEPLIGAVYTKLNLGLNEHQTWIRFVNDSGSFLISMYLNIYRDALELGGAADKVGQIVGSSMLEQVLLSDHRQNVSMGFITLLVPMHAMMVAIFLFLYHILTTMSVAVTQVMSTLEDSSAALSGTGTSVGGSLAGSLFVFANFDDVVIGRYVVIIVSMLVISNTLAGKIVMGGDRYLLYFFASLICAVSGIIYVIAPILIGLFFQIPAFEGV